MARVAFEAEAGGPPSGMDQRVQRVTVRLSTPRCRWKGHGQGTGSCAAAIDRSPAHDGRPERESPGDAGRFKSVGKAYQPTFASLALMRNVVCLMAVLYTVTALSRGLPCRAYTTSIWPVPPGEWALGVVRYSTPAGTLGALDLSTASCRSW